MPRAMTRYIFEQVTWRASKAVKCAGGCGRTVRRARTFSQTINPFNTLPSGLPKSRRDILGELEVEARNWQQDPERCTACVRVEVRA